MVALGLGVNNARFEGRCRAELTLARSPPPSPNPQPNFNPNPNPKLYADSNSAVEETGLDLPSTRTCLQRALRNKHCGKNFTRTPQVG